MIAISACTFPMRPISGGSKPRDMPGFDFEPKANGFRVLVHCPSRSCFNRHGEPLTIADSFSVPLERLKRQTAFEWLDCEGLERRHGLGKGTLIVLDVPMEKGNYLERRLLMEVFFDQVVEPKLVATNDILILPRYSADALTIWNRLQLDNVRVGCQFWEGLVFKRRDSLYNLQLQSPDQESSAWIKVRWAW